MGCEVWKSVIGFEYYYEVSNLGNVRSLDRIVNCSRGNKTRLWKGKNLSKIVAASRGYYQVSFSVDGKTSKVYVHRLVAEAFLEERNETVNHKNGNKLDNREENLEWISYSENNKHAFKTGLKLPSPVKNYKGKMNDS